MTSSGASALGTPALLAFLRLSAFFVSSPFPGTLSPPHGRLAIAAGLAWAFSSSLPGEVPQDLVLSIVFEVSLGLSMGFLLGLIMHTFAYAGEVTSQQMGLRMPGFVNPLDPNLSLLGSALAMLMLGFFAIGPGPSRMVAFLYRMFELIPPGRVPGFGAAEQIALGAGGDLFVGALQVGAPMIAAVFAAQLVLAVLARSVPTLNLFVEGPALTTSSGVIGLIATINTFGPLIDRLTQRRLEQIASWFLG